MKPNQTSNSPGESQPSEPMLEETRPDRTGGDDRPSEVELLERRDILRGVTGLGVAALLPGMLTEHRSVFAAARQFGSESRDLIRDENAKSGTRDWMLENTRIDPQTKYRCPWIEGYASKTSVRAGEEIRLHVSTNPSSPFRIDIYRMGWYGGDGGRHVASLGPFRGEVQEDPPIGAGRRRECAWEPCATLTIPDDWSSGIYLGKLTAEKDGLQSYLIFIVKDDRKADFLFQCSDTTWSAYNRWPSQFSLYDDGESNWYWGGDVEVSFDRPYGKYCQLVDAPLSTGSGEWMLWELPIAFWMESKGYDVSYISNMDTHADAAGLMRAAGFLSVGHDEYYSVNMFRNLRQAIRDGLNVAFLSGNTCCGLIDVLPAADGRPSRTIRRIDRFGPRDETGDAIFDSMKELPRTGPNENMLIGARSTGPVVGGSAYYCSKPDHWLFAGTGMQQGDGIAGLVGWEWHGDPAEIPGLEIVSQGTTKSGAGDGLYTSTIYPGPEGNLVFNASTCWWGDGLSQPPGYVRPSISAAKPQGPDPRVARITANLLERMKR